MNWPEVIAAVGGVFGVLGGVYLKILYSRNQLAKDAAENARKFRREDGAEERKNRKDTIAEYGEVIEMLRGDIRGYRDQVHDLRGESQTFLSRLTVCEAERTQMRDYVGRLAAALSDHDLPIPPLPAFVPPAPRTDRMPAPSPEGADL